jgi:Uma2 family endonuclease
MTVTTQKRYTLEEYLEFEYDSRQRHFFYKGLVLPMGYTSENHGLIIANLMRDIGIVIEDEPSFLYASERMLYVPGCQLNYYPDVMLVKGEPVLHQHTANMKATLNPFALFEVLSVSTESRDKIDKWRCYREIPSLRQYFMISQTEVYIDIYNRIGDSDSWENTRLNKSDQVLRVDEFDIPLEKIYKKVVFPDTGHTIED